METDRSRSRDRHPERSRGTWGGGWLDQRAARTPRSLDYARDDGEASELLDNVAEHERVVRTRAVLRQRQRRVLGGEALVQIAYALLLRFEHFMREQAFVLEQVLEVLVRDAEGAVDVVGA